MSGNRLHTERFKQLNEDMLSNDADHQMRQALALWSAFIVLAVIIDGTIPFLMGVNLYAWSYSTTKLLLASFIYAGLFLVFPLILVKSWKTIRQPSFLAPTLVAVLGILLWAFVPLAAVLALLVLAYLHWRFDLSKLGIRSSGWRGDIASVMLLGFLQLASVIVQPGPYVFSPVDGLVAGLNRLFANPASTVENLFYYGFMAERLSHRIGRRLTPPLIAGMYTFHEMLNPEYWYAGVPFGFIFVGVMLYTLVYMWRRSVIVLWLSDGIGRFFINLLR